MSRLECEHNIYSLYKSMDTVERIGFLEWVYSIDKHKFAYAQMSPEERKFYESHTKRGPTC